MTMKSITLTRGLQQALYSSEQTAIVMGRITSRLNSDVKGQSAPDDPINYFASKEHHHGIAGPSQGKGGHSKVTVTHFDAAPISFSVSTKSTAWAADNSILTAVSSLNSERDALHTKSEDCSSPLNTDTTRQNLTDKELNTLSETPPDNLQNDDMDQERISLLIRETRQQLGKTSFSMASQAARAVLRLY